MEGQAEKWDDDRQMAGWTFHHRIIGMTKHSNDEVKLRVRFLLPFSFIKYLTLPIRFTQDSPSPPNQFS